MLHTNFLSKALSLRRSSAPMRLYDKPKRLEQARGAPSIRPNTWPASNLVVFDCDSTLTTVEGIDELARLAASEGGSQEQLTIHVAQLTKQAMEGDLPLEAVYNLRLGAVSPTLSQVRQIASIYRRTAIPDARQVIAALQALGVQVFIVSGGLIEPVREFGLWLGVPANHIYAVDMEYDQLSGKWWRYWDALGGQNPQANYLAVETNPLTAARGKNLIIAGLRSSHPGRAILVGDGLSDLEAGEEVDLFVGFGGAVYRQRVYESSPIYILKPALSPLLPLALGPVGDEPEHIRLWADGLQCILDGQVSFHDPLLQESFLTCLRRGKHV